MKGKIKSGKVGKKTPGWNIPAGRKGAQMNGFEWEIPKRLINVKVLSKKARIQLHSLENTSQDGF